MIVEFIHLITPDRAAEKITVMSLNSLVILLGGVALFLFGMSLMGDGLKKVAGNKMEMILYRLSNTPLKGILLGTAVTGVIQSSAATSVMVVGFVNSSMMKLRQAIGVIMGFIIGTSITGWVVCLSSLGGSASSLAGFLSTEFLAAVIAISGILIRMLSKKQSGKHLADIFLGFAVLMFGMKTMSGSVSGLKDDPAFVGLMTSFSNPFLGILIGIVCTAILQSSSAAVGILQALSVSGAIPFSTAFPIILGIAIGASVPVLVSSIGANTDAKRAAISYPVITCAGVLIAGGLFYLLNLFLRFGFMGYVMNAFRIAALNSVFRLVMILLLIPFFNIILKVIQSLVRKNPDELDDTEDFEKLDERLLPYPELAVEQSFIVINSMQEKTKESVLLAISLLSDYVDKTFDRVKKLEDSLDKYEDRLGHYLMRITAKDITVEQAKNVSKFLHTVTDYERISDHAANIAESAKEAVEKHISFTPDGENEIRVLSGAVSEIVEISFRAFSKSDLQLCFRVEPLESVIDSLCDEIKAHHVARLQEGVCSFQNGYIFNDLLANFERISDHCSNIALAVIEQESNEFDPHVYINSLEDLRDERFYQYQTEYKSKYRINDK